MRASTGTATGSDASRPRLQDVAGRAGVSLATASRVLNGSSRQPGAELVERVRTAAHELGYVVNAQAQALARSRTGLLGLVVQDISDPYFSSIAAGAQSVAREQGLHLLLASTDRDPEAERDAVSAFAAHRADGIVVVGSRWGGKHDAALRRELAVYTSAGGVAVVVGQPLAGALTVQPPNVEGARALAHALVDLGLRRFAVVAGPERIVTSRERSDSFAGGVLGRGGHVETVIATQFSRDGGFAAAEQVARLARADAPRLCVFAVSDVMAIGLMAGLRRLGVEAPRDVLVAGFDDVPTLRDHTPGLTTVRIPLVEMGRRAVLAAVDASRTPGLEPLEAEVVLRESTSPPRR
ncbi:LacI family DNA-binding transcriptional regulator [Xylanimonas ulmi]|nr:LacI family DNA-binding transcriptional regulator [Xylanibacterium ulmi]